jgi:hypothetical protein
MKGIPDCAIVFFFLSTKRSLIHIYSAPQNGKILSLPIKLDLRKGLLIEYFAFMQTPNGLIQNVLGKHKCTSQETANISSSGQE